MHSNPRPYNNCRNVWPCKLQYGGSECDCPVAQAVERLPVKERVPGSIPGGTANKREKYAD